MQAATIDVPSCSCSGLDQHDSSILLTNLFHQPSQQALAPPQPTCPPPNHITVYFRQCQSIAGVHKLCRKYSHLLNPIHVSAAMTTLVRIQQQQQQQQQCMRQPGSALQAHQNLQQNSQRADVDSTVWTQPSSPSSLESSKRESQQQGCGSGQLQQSPQLQQVINTLVSTISKQVSRSSSREISNILWALAKLNHCPDHTLMERMLSHFADVMGYSSCQSISNTLYALAVLDYQPSAAWVDQAMYGFIAHADSCFPQAVSNVLWSLAKLQAPNVWLPSLLGLLRRYPVKHIQAVSNALWACAKLNAVKQSMECNDTAGSRGTSTVQQRTSPSPQPSSFHNYYQYKRGMQQHAKQLAGAVNHQQSHSRSGSFSDEVHGSLMQLLDGSQAVLTDASCQELANIIWACGKLSLAPTPVWVEEFWVASEQVLGSCKPQEISNIMFGVACCKMQPPSSWLSRFIAASQQLLPGCSPQEVANTLWGLSYIRFRPPVSCLAACVTCLGQKLTSASPCDVSMVVWSLAKLGYQPGKQFMVPLLHSASQHLTSYR
eukprot:jgi/Chrzof1/5012/Cz15g08150.t1